MQLVLNNPQIFSIFESMEKRQIDLLDELYESGKLQALIKGGLLQTSILMWRNIFHAFEFRLEATGSKMQAMEDVSQNFNISVSLVEKVRRKLGSKILM
jgi:hypothetical protein